MLWLGSTSDRLVCSCDLARVANKRKCRFRVDSDCSQNGPSQTIPLQWPSMDIDFTLEAFRKGASQEKRVGRYDVYWRRGCPACSFYELLQPDTIVRNRTRKAECVAYDDIGLGL